MDGWTLSRQVRELLNEESTSSFIDSKDTYDYLYEAACDLNAKIHTLTATQTVTTVDGTNEYDLNSDFMGLYLKNEDNKYYLKLYDGTSYYWVEYVDLPTIFYLNNTDEVAYPSRFAISDKQSLTDNVTGTATSDGDETYGLSTLTDSTAPFTNVTVGDMVHNVTDASHGIVVSITSTSAIVVSLFDGTDNEWDTDDVYVIVPKGRKILTLDPTPSTSSYYVYVEYLQKPDPVYSSYKTYRFDNSWGPALAKYAAWLYKYRDREPNYGDSWYKYYELQIRRHNADKKKMNNEYKFNVYMKK